MGKNPLWGSRVGNASQKSGGLFGFIGATYAQHCQHCQRNVLTSLWQPWQPWQLIFGLLLRFLFGSLL